MSLAVRIALDEEEDSGIQCSMLCEFELRCQTLPLQTQLRNEMTSACLLNLDTLYSALPLTLASLIPTAKNHLVHHF